MSALALWTDGTHAVMVASEVPAHAFRSCVWYRLVRTDGNRDPATYMHALGELKGHGYFGPVMDDYGPLRQVLVYASDIEQVASKPVNAYPHTCPFCGAPSYQGIVPGSTVDCSRQCKGSQYGNR